MSREMANVEAFPVNICRRVCFRMPTAKRVSVWLSLKWSLALPHATKQ